MQPPNKLACRYSKARVERQSQIDLRYMYTIYKISTKLYTKSIYKRRLSAYVHITWTRHST